MQQTSALAPAYSFLHDGGEMGTLIRQYNWSQTPCGPIDTWPVSLRTTLGILLHSSFPMFLFWGDANTCFYNDAFRPSLGSGGKHPQILGMPAAQAWPETWHFIGPLIQRVKQEGKPEGFENQLLPIYRNGELEDVYWSYSYSPAYDDGGNIAGVFVTCTDTTENIRNLQKTQESEAKYRSLFENVDEGFCIIEVIYDAAGNGKDYRFLEYNQRFSQHSGLTDAVGKTMRELVPEIEDLWPRTYGEVARTGNPAHLVQASESMQRWFEVSAYRIDGEGSNRVAVLFSDVSERRKAELQLQQNKELLQTVFDASQNSIVLLEPITGPNSTIEDFRFLMANAFTIRTTGRADLVGKGYAECFPNARTTGILNNVIQVVETGVMADFELWYEGEGMQHWFRIIATRVGKLLSLTTEDITARKQSEAAIVRSEQRFQNLVRDATVGIVVLTGPEMKMEIANEAFSRLLNLAPGNLLGKPLFEVAPGVATQYLPLLHKVLQTGDPVFLYDSPYVVTTNGQVAESYFNIVLQPYRNQQEVIVGVMALVSDVTSQVRSRQELKRSEQRFRSLIAEAPVATCLFTGADLRIEVVNPTMLQYWRKDASIIGLPFEEAMPELKTQQFPGQLKEVFATGKTFEMLAVPARLYQNGQWQTHYFDYTFKPLTDVSGQVYGVINTAIDVTAKVLTAQQVAENLHQLLASFEDVPVGLALLTGEDFRFNMANNFYGQLVGRAPDTLAGKPLMEALPELEGQGFEDLLNQVMKTGVPYVAKSAQATVVRNGVPETIHIDFTYQPHRSADGTHTGVLAVVVDVTEQVQANQKIEAEVVARTRELADANYLLEHKNRELEQFAYVASHDLQEPLRKVSTFTDMLQTHLGARDERSVMLFTRITTATRRMQQLIKDVLEYSRLSGEAQPMELVDLDKLIKELLSDFELLIEQKGARVTLEKLPVLQAIPLQMSQLFGNLLSNALKFSKPGVPPVITVGARLLSGSEVKDDVNLLPATAYTVITVQDNGIGFDKDYSDKIFSIFQRLHGKEEYSGTGIGLALCKKIVQNHQGAIWAEAQPGEGASFHVALPLAAQPEA